MEINGNFIYNYSTSVETKRICKDNFREIKNNIESKKRIFYIGATSNLKERMNAHEDEKGLDIMYVLCETTKKENAERIEKELIEKFGKLKNNLRYTFYGEPQIGGGEGLIDGVNYVYVAFGDKRIIKKALKNSGPLHCN